jgi:spore coat polysaccharide biosynthesis predicted glycosyltransferase SpsG
MTELSYIKNIGCYSDIDYYKLISILKSMDYEYRKTVSQKQQMLLDGKGTQRIVDEILKYII